MKRILSIALLSSVLAQADEVSGMIKFMKAGAKNQDKTINKSATVLGVELDYKKKLSKNFLAKVGFMSVNPINNDDTCTRIIGSKYSQKDAFAVLSEAYLQYKDDTNKLTLGRQKINTPLLASNPTLMTKETFVHSGTFEAIRYQKDFSNKTSFDVSLITRYKQRTSNKFYKLGENIYGYDSKEVDYVFLAGAGCGFSKNLKARVWGLKAKDFLTTTYFELNYRTKIKTFQVGVDMQRLDQNSNSVAVKDSHLVGAKVFFAKQGSKLMIATSKTGSNQVVLPWDGTPAFTKLCVTNATTRSIKGLGVKKYAGSYSANTRAIKVAFSQDFGRFGLAKLKGVVGFAQYKDDSDIKQKNKMIYLAYKPKKALTISTAYTKLTNFDAKSWTKKDAKSYEHYKFIVSYRF